MCCELQSQLNMWHEILLQGNSKTGCVTPRGSGSYTGPLVVHGVFAVLQIQTSFLKVHHSLLGYVYQSAGYGYT